MSVAPPTQPVIPYAEAATGGDALHWRGTDDGGVELTIAPPPLWRQLLWPALALGFFTAVIGAVMFLALLALLSIPAGATILGILIITALGAWVVMLARLWRVGRYGRLACVIRASPATLHVIAPTTGREAQRDFAATALRDVRVEDVSAVHLVVRVMKVRVVFRSGVSTEFHIPWRGGEPLAPVERRVREVLGLPAEHA
jgi:hypothetical protein